MIREITNSDFDFIYHLYMHPSVNHFLLYENMSQESFRPIFNDLVNQRIVNIFHVDEQAVGMFKLVPLFHRCSHINYLGGVAIHPDFAGKGYASKMFETILLLGKNRNLKRIELSVSTANERAIQLYKKHGFEPEGILRNYTFLKSENRYIDEQMMAFLY